MSPNEDKTIDVLVVEDTPIGQLLAKTILTSRGYTVELAATGQQALEMANAILPKVILLDVGLPDMDGYEVCRKLKLSEATRDIPVIFATGHDDAGHESRSFEVGGSDFIAKPIREDVLIARIKAHIALRSQRRSLEGMFRDVIEFAPVIFLLADPDLKIVQVNAQAEQDFGYRRKQMLGNNLSFLIPNCIDYIYPQAPADGSEKPAAQARHFELLCRRANGEIFSADATFSILRSARGLLHTVVLKDISERKETLRKLDESRSLIRELAAQHESARESERKHIAREVHDELGQVMTALRMDLSLINMQYGAQVPALDGKVIQMKALVDQGIRAVRNVAKVLRPEALDMGLVPAIDWLRSEFEKHTGIECELQLDEPPASLEESRAILVYRIVQESLTNITRYAEASKVEISLKIGPQQLVLKVRDNGKGFVMQDARSRKTFGLLGMQERAITLGGALDVESTPGVGTCISVQAPIQLTAKAEAP